MLIRRLTLTAVVLAILTGPVSADDYALSLTDGPPEGVSEAIGKELSPSGVTITGPKREYARVWLVKSATVAADFEATSSIKYPFTPGQLLGVVQIPKRAGFQDFRGNELETGTYTLRYGRQPVDGNHIGTSDLADFLMAIPADQDEETAVISDVEQLAKLSAAATGTTHPAIFSLQPQGKGAGKAELVHDEEREFWIMNTSLETNQGGAATPLPLRLIVVGVSEG